MAGFGARRASFNPQIGMFGPALVVKIDGLAGRSVILTREFFA
jgi:hypothetical protein